MSALCLLGAFSELGVCIAAAQTVNVQLTNALVTTLAGNASVHSPFSDGIGSTATFWQPSGVAMNDAGTFALVVRFRGPGDGTDTLCMLFVVISVHFDSRVCVCVLQADHDNQMIRYIDLSSGAVTSLVGCQGVSAPFSDGVGTGATFNFPYGLAINATDTNFALVVS
jgi:hypothetical protein